MAPHDKDRPSVAERDAFSRALAPKPESQYPWATPRSALKLTVPAIAVAAAAPLVAASDAAGTGCTQTRFGFGWLTQPQNRVKPDPALPLNISLAYGDRLYEGVQTAAVAPILSNSDGAGTLAHGPTQEFSSDGNSITRTFTITTDAIPVPPQSQVTIGSVKTEAGNSLPITAVSVLGAPSATTNYSATTASVHFPDVIPAGTTVTVSVTFDISPMYVDGAWPDVNENGQYDVVLTQELVDYTYPATAGITAAPAPRRRGWPDILANEAAAQVIPPPVVCT